MRPVPGIRRAKQDRLPVDSAQLNATSCCRNRRDARPTLGLGRAAPKIPYLALLPMGFSVPPGFRSERWALTPPFHPYPVRVATNAAVSFSVALSVGTPHGIAARVYPGARTSRLRGIAPYGVRTFLPQRSPGAIPRPSRIKEPSQGSRSRAERQATPPPPDPCPACNKAPGHSWGKPSARLPPGR
jgi:hypothetical protein